MGPVRNGVRRRAFGDRVHAFGRDELVFAGRVILEAVLRRRPRVHEALATTGAGERIEEIDGAERVDGHHAGVVGLMCVRAVGGEMEDPARLDRPNDGVDCGRVGHGAGVPLEGSNTGESPAVGVVVHDHVDIEPVAHESAHDVRADKSCAAGDEGDSFHGSAAAIGRQPTLRELTAQPE